jgi:hypothetical protein
MAQAKMVYTRDGLEFVWHGGAYIDIFVEGGDGSALDAYNVWDYETDTPNIKPTLEGFTEYVDSRITEAQEFADNLLSQL